MKKTKNYKVSDLELIPEISEADKCFGCVFRNLPDRPDDCRSGVETPLYKKAFNKLGSCVSANSIYVLKVTDFYEIF